MNINKVAKAKKFARDLHKDHIRLSGEPVYEHTIRTYEKLKKLGVNDETILVSAILHQSLSFSDEVKPSIEEEFGKEVLEIVENYKRLSNISVSHEGSQGVNEKYILQTYLNLAKDLKVLLIRLADKVDNIDTAFALSRKQQKKVAEKALYVYSPIARLLGLMQFSDALENGAFKVLYPKEYYRVEKMREEKRPEIEKFFKENIPAIKDLLKESGVNTEISFRLKGIYSIYKKAIYISTKNKGKVTKDYEGIYDLVAMRIITDTVEGCYKTEAVIDELWEPITDERDDYIKNPKPNGYKSIHNLHKAEKDLIVEVQIRTKEMHDYNEYGPASHLYYKVGKDLAKSLETDPDTLKKLKNWQDERQENEETDYLKQFRDDVYVFTPKGDIIKLPKGATPVDFAYEIHTKIGNSCVGAVVNGEIKKLDYQLHNGDQVEIKTLSNKKKPSSDWLEFVKSSKAKHDIRKELKL